MVAIKVHFIQHFAHLHLSPDSGSSLHAREQNWVLALPMKTPARHGHRCHSACGLHLAVSKVPGNNTGATQQGSVAAMAPLKETFAGRPPPGVGSLDQQHWLTSP